MKPSRVKSARAEAVVVATAVAVVVADAAALVVAAAAEAGAVVGVAGVEDSVAAEVDAATAVDAIAIEPFPHFSDKVEQKAPDVRGAFFCVYSIVQLDFDPVEL